MNKYIETVKSTLIVLVISTLGAFGFYLFNLNFWAAFFILFCLQYIAFALIADLVKSFFSEKTKQLELEKLEPLSTILECAFCNTKNMMVFIPDENERVEFECSSCKNKNLVNIQFMVARITEPVTVPNVTGIPLIQDEK